MNKLHEVEFVIWPKNFVENLDDKNCTSRTHENECRVWGQKYEISHRQRRRRIRWEGNVKTK